LRAHAEAAFDFADEADVPPDVDRDAASSAAAIAGEIEAMLADSHRGEIVRQGFQVVIMGQPNAGKSSLMNALAQREVAIVSPEPGTTRDLIEVALDLGGNKVVLVDSAGLRDIAGLVEQEGMRRARERARSADLILWLSPVNEAVPPPTLDVSTETLVIRSKDDSAAYRIGGVSVVRPGGLDWIVDELSRRAQATAPLGHEVMITRSRHRTGLSACAALLREAAGGVGLPAEIRAELLRMAGDEIGRLIGKIGVEDLLDRIFSEFCIGK
jgi:tRNA modification GTPase